MTITLISYLTGQGVADAVAGNLSAFIALPWSLKLLWALIIDSISFPSMGRRRPWIIGAELMMATTLLWFMALYDPISNIALLGWIFFAHNCFASLQDVLADALAIDILSNEELGVVNGLMMASKQVGVGCGAAGLAVIMQQWGFKPAVLVQFVLLILIMLLPLFILERPGEKLLPWSHRKLTGHVNLHAVSPLNALKDLRRAYCVRDIAALTMLGLLAGVSEWLVEIINKPFYTKVLGWTFVKFSAVSGALLILQLAAALAGGWAARRFGWRATLLSGLGAYGLLALTFGIFNQFLIHTWFPVLFLFLPPAANVFGSVAFFSTAMRMSWTRSAATVFTTLVAVTSFGHVIGGWVIGPLRDGLGLDYRGVYCLGGILMLASLLLLFAVEPRRVDKIKLSDTEV